MDILKDTKYAEQLTIRASTGSKSFTAQYETSRCKFIHIWAIYLLKRIVFIHGTNFEPKDFKIIIREW